MRQRLAILCDYPEEGWLSMDLVAEMLHRELAREHGERFESERLCPTFRRRATLMPLVRRHRHAFNFDRFLNRMRDYPNWLDNRVAQFDLFHVADHSYAGLVHALPAERSGVYCHDLDAFRSILDPASLRRPAWFRAMIHRILRGMQSAAVVFHSTAVVREQILRAGLVDPARLVHAPLGVAEEFSATDDGAAIEPAVVAAAEAPFVLHVGSCALRKRIDVLLQVFAELRRTRASLRLVKVGGEWKPEHHEIIAQLELDPAITHLVGLDRRSLAWLYRRAAVVLLTSDAEGFGLPTIEALACGAPVVASDLPVFREVGADAVVYCPVGDIATWAQAAGAIINDVSAAPPRAVRLAQAARFTWSAHARIIADTYARLIGDGR